MKLSNILHKHINKGRKGRSDALNATDVSLTDAQLMEMWEKATELESDFACLHRDVKRLGDKKFRSERE